MITQQGISLRPDPAAMAVAETRSWQRAVTASALACQQRSDPATVLRSAWPNDQRALTILKAAKVPTDSTTYPANNVVATFQSIAPGSAAAALFALSPNKLNMSGIYTISIPRVSALPPAAVFVAEAAPAPVLNFTMAATIVGPVKKILVMSAVTRELENAGPELASVVIARTLADAAHKGVDAVAFGTAAGDAVKPPGLLNGTTPITAATAGAGAMATDLAALVAAIATAGIDTTDVAFVAGAREAALIKFAAGPQFDSPVLTTTALPAGTVAAFAPSALFWAYDGTPTIETSTDTVLHFEDTTPTDISTSGSAVAFPTKSMFQTDTIAIKVRANCAWAVAPGGAQQIATVNW